MNLNKTKVPISMFLLVGIIAIGKRVGYFLAFSDLPLGASILAFFLLGETVTLIQLLLAGCLLLVGVGLFLRSNEKA